MVKKNTSIFEIFATQTMQPNIGVINARNFPMLGNNVSRNGIREILAGIKFPNCETKSDVDCSTENANYEFFGKNGSPFRKRFVEQIDDGNVSLVNYAAKIIGTPRVESNQRVLETDHSSPRHSCCIHSRFHQRSITCPISSFFAQCLLYAQKIFDFVVQGCRKVFQIDSEAKILINEMSITISNIHLQNRQAVSSLEEKVRCLTIALHQAQACHERSISELTKRLTELQENTNESTKHLHAQIKNLEKDLKNSKVSNERFSVPPPPPPLPPPTLFLCQPICSLQNPTKSLLKKIAKDMPKRPVITAEDLKKVVLKKWPRNSESLKHKNQSPKTDASLDILRNVKLRSVQRDKPEKLPSSDDTFTQLLDSSQRGISSPVKAARNH